MQAWLCWSLFLIKLQPFRSATLLKKDSNIGVFLWMLLIFQVKLFYKTPPMAPSRHQIFHYDSKTTSNYIIPFETISFRCHRWFLCPSKNFSFACTYSWSLNEEKVKNITALLIKFELPILKTSWVATVNA